jgi:predicted ATP-dependent endonuclease of OLD family
MIFHLAAIYSNRDAVILFEEPEAHTYAPYQSYLAGEIIEDEQNQYFITTHSEQIFDSILRPNPEKVAVFFV